MKPKTTEILIAAIDVGANAVRLEIARGFSDGSIESVHQERDPVRPGEGLCQTGTIPAVVVDRLIGVPIRSITVTPSTSFATATSPGLPIANATSWRASRGSIGAVPPICTIPPWKVCHRARPAACASWRPCYESRTHWIAVTHSPSANFVPRLSKGESSCASLPKAPPTWNCGMSGVKLSCFAGFSPRSWP
jgi:hypothetical protein